MKRPIEVVALHASLAQVSVYKDGARITFGENVGEEVSYHTSIFLPTEALDRVFESLVKAIGAKDTL
jgi:hypothetical protein